MRRGGWVEDLRRFRAGAGRGVVRARTLVELGMPERTVYRRCRDGGPWTRLLPGVVLLSDGQPTRVQQIEAALLLGGADAVVTGLEACHRHGVRRGPRPSTEVHLLVPHHRQVRSVGYVHVERTLRMPTVELRDGLPLAPPVRACVDAARRLRSRAEITELIADSVQRGLCAVDSLAEEIAACGRRGSAVPRSVVAEVREGARSIAEAEARSLLRRSGLPTPWSNASVFGADGRLVGIADFWWDDVALLWEIESTEWHLAPADHDRSVARAARFASLGAVYIPTKPSAVRYDGAAVLRTLRAAHAQAAARPRPPLRAVRLR
jgi:hypothetical protein